MGQMSLALRRPRLLIPRRMNLLFTPLACLLQSGGSEELPIQRRMVSSLHSLSLAISGMV